jgi:hypothetical protein
MADGCENEAISHEAWHFQSTPTIFQLFVSVQILRGDLGVATQNLAFSCWPRSLSRASWLVIRTGVLFEASLERILRPWNVLDMQRRIELFFRAGSFFRRKRAVEGFDVVSQMPI